MIHITVEIAVTSAGSVVSAARVYVLLLLPTSVKPATLEFGCGELNITDQNFTPNTSVQVSGRSTYATVEAEVKYISSSQLIATIDCTSRLPADIYNVCVTNGPGLMNCGTGMLEAP